jgi:hypothetical protein
MIPGADYGINSGYTFIRSGSRWIPVINFNAVFRTAEFSPTPALMNSEISTIPPWTFSAIANQALPMDSSLLFGMRYSTGRDESPDTSSIFSYFAARLGSSLNFRAGLSLDNDGYQKNTARQHID